MTFTKETAGFPHKRGGAIKVSDRTKSKIHLDMLCGLTRQNRNAIVSFFKKYDKNTHNIEHVIEYIKMHFGKG